MNAKNICLKTVTVSFLAIFWLTLIGATCWMKTHGYDDGSWKEIRIVSAFAMASFLVSVFFTVTSDDNPVGPGIAIGIPAVLMLLSVLLFIIASWVEWLLPGMEDISCWLGNFVRVNLFAIPLGQYAYRALISGN